MECHICKFPSVQENNLGWIGFACPRCGLWTAIGGHGGISFREALGPFEDPKSRHRRSKLSHIVRHGQEEGRYFGVAVERLASMGLDGPLPTPLEQIDNLILWLGQNQDGPAGAIAIDPEAMSALAGALIAPDNQTANLGWLLSQPKAKEYFESRPNGMRLTLSGWERFQQLITAKVESRFAFMAMKFCDPELDQVFENCLAPAVDQAGFELKRLSDGQAAGLIDDQMRVRLRTCRFVIADLTHGNNGAYWEAGFAEGLGRPVIYTCKRSVWEDEKTRPHFDTSHLVTIIWDPENLAVARDRLAATIQATLPGGARMP